ncbi:MAG: SdpI family protein [[Ruminococcus] gnavus]|nr:SdpI family protein [Mediterraneibacter gnavus]
MKENKSKVIITSIVTLFPMFIGFLLWNRLPEKVATHFSGGVADGWSTKLSAVVFLPVVLLVIHLFCLGVTLNDPKKRNIGNMMMSVIFWIVPVLSLVSNLSIYGYALGMDLNIEMIVGILVGAMFLLLGNYMSKSHQNYTVGIKLPWTLNSEENWNRTHRLAGKLWIFAGILFIGNIFFQNWQIPFVVTIAVVIIPMIYSFLLYKKGI